MTKPLPKRHAALKSVMDSLRNEFVGRKGQRYLAASVLTGSGIAGMITDPAIPGAGWIAGLGGALLVLTWIFVAPDGFVDPSPPSSSFDVPPEESLEPALIVTYPEESGFFAVVLSVSGATVVMAGPFDSREAAVAELDGVPDDVPVYDVDALRAKALEAVEPHRAGWLQDAMPILQVVRETRGTVP